jgi:hypothetical protein
MPTNDLDEATSIPEPLPAEEISIDALSGYTDQPEIQKKT